MTFNNDNRGGKLGAVPELELTAEAKSSLVGSDPISTALDELDFQDAMKRSIILGICTRLVNSGERSMGDLVLEIKDRGAMVFLRANMEAQAPASSDLDEINSVRDVFSHRRPMVRKSPSTSMLHLDADAMAEAQQALEADRAAAEAERPVDGDTLLERIRSRMADALVSDPSGSGEGDKGE